MAEDSNLWPPAVAVRSSSTVVGLHWQSVAGAGSGFAGSPPIAGKVELEGILISVQKVPAAGDPHRFRLAIATEIAASQAAIDGEHQLFPYASSATDSRYDLVVAWGDAGLFFPVETVLALNGRRIVGRWYNGSAVVADAYLGLVLHGVIGGESLGAPGFLVGEPVVDA